MSDRAAVNPPLIWIGALLALFGAIVLTLVLAMDRQPADPPAETVQRAAATAPPSRVWPIVAGLSLAIGAGCIGIGMNRWGAAA
jgi:hypothetical protein